LEKLDRTVCSSRSEIVPMNLMLVNENSSEKGMFAPARPKGNAEI
jgi:hypothetical protein